jgi:transcriptional regulator with XRE-family HTH domain
MAPGRKLIEPDALDSETSMAHLGRTIRTNRAGLLTVEELAERAGISAGLISQLERGIGNPSFNTLMRLSRALNLPISALFHGGEKETSDLIVRKADRLRLTRTEDGIKQEILSPDVRRKLGLIRTVVPPGYSGTDTPMSHPGEEAFLVVKGSLEVTLGQQTYELAVGDTITFDSSVPHALSNPGDEPAEFIGCSTPPAAAGCY